MDIFGDSAKRTVFAPPSAGVSLTICVLEMATRSEGTTSVTSKVALTAGSSQQGKARRASVASNWVVARYR